MDEKGKNIHQELIDRCRAHDRKAQFELYKIYYKPMYNTSLRILNNPQEAEDVMQESFLAAFSKLDDYSGEGNFGGWLRRIVVNRSIDNLKKKHPDLSFDEEFMDVEDSVSTYQEEVEYRIAEIKKAVESLPEEHRVIISLILFEGYDHEEITQILGISYNASRTRYSRARQKLLALLSEQRTLKLINPN